MSKTAKPKKKKAAGKNGSSAVEASSEEEEPTGTPDGLDALVGLIDHDAEAEEHALLNGAKAGEEDEDDMSSLKEVFDDVVKIEDARAALQWTEIECPHCEEAFLIGVDPDDDGQDIVKDCQMCSRPIQMSVDVDGEDANVTVFPE